MCRLLKVLELSGGYLKVWMKVVKCLTSPMSATHPARSINPPVPSAPVDRAYLESACDQSLQSAAKIHFSHYKQ